MKIFITNLPVSVDRKKHILGQLDGSGLDFEFVDCIVGKNLTDAQIREACDVEEIRKLNSTVQWINKGMIGCSLTSQKIHREILERKLDCAVLLEDDTLLPNNFKAILDECSQVLVQGDVILLFWLAGGPVRLNRESRILLDSLSLYETPDAHLVHGGSATIFTHKAVEGLLRDNTPIHTSPDSWGHFVAQGCINRLLLAYPIIVDTADFMSTMELGRFVGIRRFINKYQVFPFFQILRHRRQKMKKTRQLAEVK